MSDQTMITRPKHLQRPPDLWRAWERTAGYVAFHNKQNVTVSLTWADDTWTAQFTWIDNMEETSGHATPGDALVELWKQIEAGYVIFQNPMHTGLAPRNYPPEQWFHEAEHTILHRLISLAAKRYQPQAALMVFYRPLSDPGARAQARLVGQGDASPVGGQGANLLEACRDLYRRAALRLGVNEDFNWY